MLCSGILNLFTAINDSNRIFNYYIYLFTIGMGEMGYICM